MHAFGLIAPWNCMNSCFCGNLMFMALGGVELLAVKYCWQAYLFLSVKYPQNVSNFVELPVIIPTRWLIALRSYVSPNNKLYVWSIDTFRVVVLWHWSEYYFCGSEQSKPTEFAGDTTIQLLFMHRFCLASVSRQSGIERKHNWGNEIDSLSSIILPYQCDTNGER